MIFFKPTPAENIELAYPCDMAHFEIFDLFNGSSLKDYWLPIKFERITEDEGKTLKPSDFPTPMVRHFLIMKKKAHDVFADIFIKNGEILPLSTDDDVELYVFNSQVIDALDEDNSSIKRFPNSRKIMYIKKHEFIKSKLLDVDMFRLPYRASSIFVSERFVERYKSTGLVGLDFEEVWRFDNCKIADCYENTIEPKYDFEKAWNNVKCGCADENDYDITLDFSKKCIELNPNDVLAYDAIGLVYLRKHNYDKAIECYEKAIELNTPDLAGTFNDMGLAYIGKLDYDKAIECYKKAIELELNFAEAYFNIGNAYIEKLDYDKAIECYEKAIELNPDLKVVYTNMGIAYEEKQNHGKAIECYEKAIELEPNKIEAFFNMGNVYNKKQNYDKAIEYYKNATKLNPNCANIYRNMGVAYEEKQNHDKAIECYEKAIELEPIEMIVVYDYIGELYIKKGNKIKGMEYKKKALRNCDAPPECPQG
jgi:tetratricopeptide (TPR) repeat protein